MKLYRRGYDLGNVPLLTRPLMQDIKTIKQTWLNNKAILLPEILTPHLKQNANSIAQSAILMENVLDNNEFYPFINKNPYKKQMANQFSIAAISEEGQDEQAIEKIYFQSEDDKTSLVETWCKASWLSYDEYDSSLRFRFSSGIEGSQEVTAEINKQDQAAKLCDTLFPESVLITKNRKLGEIFLNILGKIPNYVERIVYFNSPNGGAQMHHDVERGHIGVVYAQLTGSTFWLALAKPQLLNEIITFVNSRLGKQAIKTIFKRNEQLKLFNLCHHRDKLSQYMEKQDHQLIEMIIDKNPSFISQLIEKGYAYCLKEGDVLLLPQKDKQHCVWHSVFALGEISGEALSFAVRQ